MGLVFAGPARYDLHDIDPDRVRRLQCNLGLSRIVSSLLVRRGIEDEAQARDFLAPDLDRDWTDPSLIPGMDEVARRVADAIAAGEHIVIFGDFDADGVTATATLALALPKMGAHVSYVLPRRLTEGYGLSEAACERVLAERPDLVVTVDNGISAAVEVELLRSHGISVVVTDHHEPGDAIPQGIPLADPKLEEECPARDLAGVGVALKLVCAVGRLNGHDGLWRDYLDLATLGTIGDQMPLLGENRAIVSSGLSAMLDHPRPAIAAFVAGERKDGALSAESLSFSLLPRINSAGRMGDAVMALSFLMAQDASSAAKGMQELEVANTARRQTEAECAQTAFDLAERGYHGERAVVLASEDFHEGVKGIVASRLVTRYQVPVILFHIDDDGMAYGSGRSFGQVDLFGAVRSCGDVLERFGGHAAAVGATCRIERFEEFRERLLTVLDALPDERFVQLGDLDLDVELSELDLDEVDGLQRLAPFGNANRYPVFISRSLFMCDRKAVGSASNHFSCVLSDGTARIRGICFGPHDLEALLETDRAVDVVFSPDINEFRGTRSVQAKIIEVIAADEPALADVDEQTFIDELDGMSESCLDQGDYAHIGDADSFHTKVAGVTFEGRQDILAALSAPVDLDLAREADNGYDPNAIAVISPLGQIGYLNARLSKRLAPPIDQGTRYAATLTEVTGGTEGASLGANICVYKADLRSDSDQDAQRMLSLRNRWSDRSSEALEDSIREALIGKRELHDAQSDSLSALEHGRNVLCVMATGRGKSLIFQMHAIRTALESRQASIFIYPLRALVADQAWHLKDVMAPFGLSAAVITGESNEEERGQVFSDLSQGRLDCLLTTPEFLNIHAERFAGTGRVGFVAVDEAHHIGQGQRAAYASLDHTLDLLGSPTVLAVTATADRRTAERITTRLSIDETILDATVRDNLVLDDLRDVHERDLALAHIVADGGKTVVYVNSREQSVRLARLLRRMVPSHAFSTAFYNAGLDRATRSRIEHDLREGRLDTVIATSAFGEGVDIPDIRNVVLYHLPFSATEFNQMSGRCGRDGDEASVHLLFGGADARLNERILEGSAPTRDDLVTLWKVLRRSADDPVGQGVIARSNAELSGDCASVDPRTHINDAGVSCGVSIFRELGLIESRGYGTARTLSIVPGASRADLESSTRYLEGHGQLDEFARFREWVFSATSEELLGTFNHPILPQ